MNGSRLNGLDFLRAILHYGGFMTGAQWRRFAGEGYPNNGAADARGVLEGWAVSDHHDLDWDTGPLPCKHVRTTVSRGRRHRVYRYKLRADLHGLVRDQLRALVPIRNQKSAISNPKGVPA